MLSALDIHNSPFTEGQLQRLRQGLEGLDAHQSAWLSGYLAGRLANDTSAGATLGVAPAARKAPVLEVFYASETGNGQGVAEALARRAGQSGLALKARTLDGYRAAGLAQVRRAVFVISTHGDGDPPEEAIDLFDYLRSPRAADLSGLEFSVLALGDRSYSKFCEAGRQLEELLLARGARAFAPRVECDVDYEQDAETWSAGIVDHAARIAAESASEQHGPVAAPAAHLSVVAATSGWTRKRPFQAEVLATQKITGLESDKDVYHVELSLADSGLRYEPGDALGVWPVNADETVAAILDGLRIDPDERVERDGETHSMRDWLARHREITRLAPATLRDYAGYAADGALSRHLDGLDDAAQRAYLERRQFVDLVEEHPARIDAGRLLELLRPLSPRSYSIASSQAAVGDEVHLTVATLFSDAIGRQRRGVASQHLNHRLQAGDRVGVFLEANRRFRLPDDRSSPLILIGAGTGIAPYRAFLQQLEAEGEAPESWLIFGNPHLRTDFLYQREWLRWRDKGLLQRIDCAFSRDQRDKRYVQHVVAERAGEVIGQLKRGAHLYLCGGLAMGRAVEEALRTGAGAVLGLDPPG
ncbi:MAG: flavodoxin domain-containing protein, partial [Xanthomonadales bacterium]|nr:flavodoxin domain-containing protein [Xanthomonadales bacterium]